MTKKAILFQAFITISSIFLVYPLTAQGQVIVQFHAGWNLFSLPLIPDNETLLRIASEVLPHLKSIWTYNAFSEEWEYYVTGGQQKAVDPTALMIPSRSSYWVDMGADVTLTITGEGLSNRAVYLWAGLNMAGYGSSAQRQIEEGSFSKPQIDHSIWAYDTNPAGKWLVYSPDAPDFVDGFADLVPGIGYMIYVEEECIWDPFLNSIRTFDITPAEAFTLIQDNESNPNFAILDVRTPEEFASGHIENAINMDFRSASFEDDLSQLDRNKTYLEYCKAGSRSAAALTKMDALGFVEVFNMLGGIDEWKAQGYPTTTD